MTRNPGQLSPGSSDPVRQKIVAIEYTISTTMPGAIGLESLKQFAKDVIEAIEFLRASYGHCHNRSAAISCLERAKIPLQLATDELRPGGNSKRRYQNIDLFGQGLKDALKHW